MESSEKNYLLGRLDETHFAIKIILEGIDLELRVYTDTDWRIRDILGHIATWDREVTKSLRAFLAKIEYVIPDLDEEETGYNENAVTEQRRLSTDQIMEEWEQAREDFKAALRDIPADHFPGDLLFPWGDERGSITRLVEYMTEHNEEHRDEILVAMKRSKSK